MKRRTILEFGGTMIGATVGTGILPVSAAKTDLDTDDSITFDGEGPDETDEFELKDGPMMIEAVHDGEEEFLVDLVPFEEEDENESEDEDQNEDEDEDEEKDQNEDEDEDQVQAQNEEEDKDDYRIFNYSGELDGSGGAFVESGEYTIEVEADGAWELSVTQPREGTDDPDELPLSYEGNGPTWIGPILFEQPTEFRTGHEGNWHYRIDLVPQEEDNTEFVWHYGEFVVAAIGEMEAFTESNTEGVGYLSVRADGDWIIRLE
ncbi:hypothetical protein OB955_21930 [Halobacteria archaeon AArc-m2/3/4]|uniref:Uncharacterized protein n=1 Tax=Natronoglomus mannanivorans TaxID=2979990 RepID=A0ABT2QK86_9EURY|nr:hypothetical protein [Halobacteria archaeon AArc-m2/3/4]